MALAQANAAIQEWLVDSLITAIGIVTKLPCSTSR